MAKKGLNGSVNLLADAMRKVFTEAVEGAVEPLTAEVKALRTETHDMEGRLNKRIDETNKKIDDGLKTTNENVQAQLAQQNKNVQAQLSQHRKDVSADVTKIVKGC